MLALLSGAGRSWDFRVPIPGVQSHQRSASLPEDIKYIEVTSPRPRCHDGPPSCSSPSVTPPSGSPHTDGRLLCRDVPRETRSSAESLIFSGSQARGPSPWPSPSIAIPCVGGRASGPQVLGSPLLASPGSEKALKALTPQRGSKVSVLSTSPASDVSYTFGRWVPSF